jgi:hypothetical protein
MDKPMPGHDAAMQAKQVKAGGYAAQPERFTLLNTQIELKLDGGYYVVECRGRLWDCTCGKHHEISPCEHVLAVKQVLTVNITLP